MSYWTTKSLRERTVNLDSQRRPVRASDRKPGPYPYYGASGIVDYVDDYIFEGLHLLVAEDGENLRSRKTPIAFLADDKFWVNNHAHILVANKENDTRFLSYAIEALDVVGYLSGSTQPKLTQDALGRIQVLAPDADEQRAIAATLGALDDKTASDRKISSVALSLLDRLAEIAEQSLPTVPVTSLVETPRDSFVPANLADQPVDHFSLPAFDSNGRPDRVPGEEIKSGKLRVAEPSVLVSRLNPRIDRTWFAVPDLSVPAAASTEFCVMRPREGLSLGALWLAVRSEQFRSGLISRVTGTSGSHQRVRPDDVLSLAVPDVRSLANEARQADSLLDVSRQRLREATRLEALRNSLLPGLLSGDVGVAQAGARA
jgi:type I restriction enzyme S subunit